MEICNCGIVGQHGLLMAERLKIEMETAGLSVTFVSFNGDHEIPEEVVVALNGFLHHLKLAGK